MTNWCWEVDLNGSTRSTHAAICLLLFRDSYDCPIRSVMEMHCLPCAHALSLNSRSWIRPTVTRNAPMSPSPQPIEASECEFAVIVYQGLGLNYLRSVTEFSSACVKACKGIYTAMEQEHAISQQMRASYSFVANTCIF